MLICRPAVLNRWVTTQKWLAGLYWWVEESREKSMLNANYKMLVINSCKNRKAFKKEQRKQDLYCRFGYYHISLSSWLFYYFLVLSSMVILVILFLNCTFADHIFAFVSNMNWHAVFFMAVFDSSLYKGWPLSF